MHHPWLEYGIVAVSLVVTVAIGFYFSRGVSSVKIYMLGSRKMTALPISLSIVATYISGSSIVSTSQEVYLFGLQSWFTSAAYIIFGIGFAYVVLPVSYSVKSASTFEYFSRRFNGHVRKYASLVYALEMIFFTAVSQYIPALSLSQATGLPVFSIACVLSFISWAYTATGGLRAVTYTDSFQAVLLIGVILVLFFVGVSEVGGFVELWRKGVDGSRMEFFDFNLDYSLRYSIPIGLVGGSVVIARSMMSASFHQRVVAMPTYEDAKKAAIWSSILTGLCNCFTYFMGIVVYAYFAGCDPVLAKQDIKSYATILPYFVTQVSKRFPGLIGLFLTGVIAAGLSTTTSCWNTVSCTLYEDIVLHFLPKNLSKRTSLRVLTLILTGVTLISTSCILVIDQFPSLMEASLTMKSFTTSSSITLYICGMTLPWINSKGAIVGSIVSSLTTSFIALGGQRAKMSKLVKDIPKILTTAQCVVNGTTMAEMNKTISVGTQGFGLVTIADPSVPWYFKIGMGLYSSSGILVGLSVAFVASLMTGHADLNQVDREMIVPCMRWTLPPPSSSKLTTMDDSEIPLNPLPPKNQQ